MPETLTWSLTSTWSIVNSTVATWGILDSASSLTNMIPIDANYLGLWILIFIWLWVILWVTKDISARTSNIFFQIFSIAIVAILTPVVWLPIYFLIRPIWYKYEKEFFKNALIFSFVECKECGQKNDKDFKYCVNCWTHLKTTCKECKTLYPWDFPYCPECWAPNYDTLKE